MGERMKKPDKESWSPLFAPFVMALGLFAFGTVLALAGLLPFIFAYVCHLLLDGMGL